MPSVNLSELLASPIAKLPPGPRGPKSRENHRIRLLSAVLHAVSVSGYPDAKVADIVERAQVSRRTFYEHFTDKEQCFLAAYEVWAGLLSDRLRESGDPARGWTDRLLVGLDAYLAAITASPALTRVFQIDILLVGHAGVRRRREAYRLWAGMLAGYAAEAQRSEGLRLRELSPQLWEVLVASVNERVLLAVDGVEVVADQDALRRDVLTLILNALMPSRPEGLDAALLARAATLRSD